MAYRKEDDGTGMRVFMFLFGVGLVVMAVFTAMGKIPVHYNDVETDNIFVRLFFVFLGGGMGLGCTALSILGDGDPPKFEPSPPGTGLLQRLGHRVRVTTARTVFAFGMIGWAALSIAVAASSVMFVVGSVVQTVLWIWRLIF